MNIAICDDNELQLELLTFHVKNFLRQRGDSSCIIETYTEGRPLIDDVKDGKWFDIIILDILLKSENGIDVGKTLRASNYEGDIVFWTAYDKYAYSALDIKITHYILKGHENGRLYAVLDNALRRIRKRMLTVRSRDSVIRVYFDRIEFIESRNKHCIIHCSCGVTYISCQSLSSIEQVLDRRFLRCHQSYIVNMDFIKKAGTDFVVFSGSVVPIRKRNVRAIKEKYLEYIK